MCKKSCTFVADMRKRLPKIAKGVAARVVAGIAVFVMAGVVMTGCNKPSKVEQYRAEKHERDSAGLADQKRSMAYYEQQLAEVTPKADSLLAYFRYEKNDKYQDHGNYVVQNAKLKVWNELRVLVRDDGGALLVYKNGKRLSDGQVAELVQKEDKTVLCAMELQTVMRDIRELEKRIQRTSLEIQKYEKRLERIEN